MQRKFQEPGARWKQCKVEPVMLAASASDLHLIPEAEKASLQKLLLERPPPAQPSDEATNPHVVLLSKLDRRLTSPYPIQN